LQDRVPYKKAYLSICSIIVIVSICCCLSASSPVQ
jgi:hypothetical protein